MMHIPIMTWLLVLLLTASLSIQAKPSIDWLHPEWLPYFIVDGPNKGKGESDKILKRLTETLPQYQHNMVDMNFSRFWTLTEKGWHVCSSIAFVNDQRKRYTRFSHPVAIILSQRIIVRNETLDELGRPVSISLLEQMNNMDLDGALLAKRSYTSPIDRLLAEHEVGSNIQRLALNSTTTIPMLILKRMDYTLEYLSTAVHYEKKVTGVTGTLGSILIEEIPDFTYTHVACPNNKWGKKVIRAINRVLSKIRPTKEFQQLVELNAVGDKDGLKTIREAYPYFLEGKYPW